MTAHYPGTPDAFVRLRASGWIISLCLHGTAVFLAGLFVAKIGLAPPSSSFRWDVSVVTQPAAPPTVSTSPSKPTITPKTARATQHSAPMTSMRSAPPEPPDTTASASTSTGVTPEPHTAAPVLSPPTQDISQVLERPVTPSISEPQKPAHEQSATAPPEPLVASQPQPLLSSSPAPESPPSVEPSSTLYTLPRAPENSSSPTQTAALAPATSAATVARKPDYGWLAAILLPRIEALKQYPVAARLLRAEGRVIIRIVILEDGQIVSATIAKSSGHDLLDQAALETIRQASPLTLSQPLEKSTVTIQIPLGYYLHP